MPLFAVDAAILAKLGFYGVQGLVVLAGLAVLLRAPLKPRWAWSVTALGLATLVVWNCSIEHNAADFKVFWRAGTDVLAGRDPYENRGCVNPPTAFALYAPWALLPFDASLALWCSLNIIGAAALVWCAHKALASADGDTAWHLPAPALAVLTAMVAMSVSTRYGMEVGQVALLTTLALVLAVYGWLRGWAVPTGVGLALASVKAATMLPFLLLLHRRRDVRAWGVLIVAGLGLYALANPPTELFSRLNENLANIAYLGQPGRMNDYAVGGINADMISVDRALYFCGLTDRTLVRMLQLGTMAVVGVWVGWRVMGKKALPPVAACCLVAFFAAMFLYHRLYDMLILILPLVYATGRARHETGAARWLYTASAATIIGLLYLRLEVVKAVIAAVDAGQAPAQWVQALVIPHAFWLLTAALAFFAAAEQVRAARTVEAEQELPRTEGLRFGATFAERFTSVADGQAR